MIGSDMTLWLSKMTQFYVVCYDTVNPETICLDTIWYDTMGSGESWLDVMKYSMGEVWSDTVWGFLCDYDDVWFDAVWSN